MAAKTTKPSKPSTRTRKPVAAQRPLSPVAGMTTHVLRKGATIKVTLGNQSRVFSPADSPIETAEKAARVVSADAGEIERKAAERYQRKHGKGNSKPSRVSTGRIDHSKLASVLRDVIAAEVKKLLAEKPCSLYVLKTKIARHFNAIFGEGKWDADKVLLSLLPNYLSGSDVALGLDDKYRLPNDPELAREYVERGDRSGRAPGYVPAETQSVVDCDTFKSAARKYMKPPADPINSKTFRPLNSREHGKLASEFQKGRVPESHPLVQAALANTAKISYESMQGGFTVCIIVLTTVICKRSASGPDITETLIWRGVSRRSYKDTRNPIKGEMQAFERAILYSRAERLPV